MDENAAVHLLIGLTLHEAQRSLLEDATLAVLPQHITETALPQLPRREGSAPRKKKTPDKAPRAPKRFGEWRVLNCKVNNEDNERRLELLVAREELKPLPSQETLASTELNL